MRVNCNISAIIANNSLATGESSLDRAIHRLSTGLKINKAEDDPAGIAISKQMKTQIQALEQANRNASDGVSVVQTAESSLSEIQNILQRVRQLAVQSADGVNGEQERAAIQAEVDQLMDEVDRISSDTQFNTLNLLDGTAERRSYADTNGVYMKNTSAGVKAGQYQFTVTSAAKQATTDLNTFTGTVPANKAGSMIINGATIEVNEGDTINDIYEKILNADDKAGMQVECRNAGGVTSIGSATSIKLTNNDYGKLSDLSIEFSSADVASLFGVTGTERIVTGTDAVIAKGNGFSSTASVSVDGTSVTVSDVTGFKMQFEVPGDTLIASPCTLEVTDIGTLSIQVGANENQMINLDIAKINVATLGLTNINVETEKSAGISISKLDAAITRVSSERSKLGAYQNRLESTVQNLGSYTENITAALSRLEDCDMAEEMTEYTQQNVITQAATSVLAQANEKPQTILQMLQ